MREIIKNTKGAVTVFVTLLLIPAVLVSGTAVDLTRIYTARSIVQDANQLAANSVLSQYNALLHDLYGVFGIAENDPVLAGLLDEYIDIAVFGEDGKDTGMGTLQLFYGSNLSLDGVGFADNKSLSNPDVLRHQIEEYMKFRAPVIIIKELLELLGSSTFKEDTGVIGDKLDIDEAIAAMHEKYRELYVAILAADLCEHPTQGIGGTVGRVSAYLQNIRDVFVELRECYEDWKEESDKEDEQKDSEKMDDLAAKYKALLSNLKPWASGGQAGKNWKNGKWSSMSGTLVGLKDKIAAEIITADTFKPKFDDVVSIARQIDEARAELAQKIEQLDKRLRDGACNDELREALTESAPGAGKSVMDMYRDILAWDDIERMADTFKDGGYQYIDGPVKETLDAVMYRHKDKPYGAKLTRQELENARSDPRLALSEADDMVTKLAGYTNLNISYGMPDGFIKFGEYPGKNKAFFEELTKMMEQPDIPPVKLYDGQEEAGGKDAEKRQRGMIDEVLKLVDEAYAGLTNDPLGAKYISAGPGSTDTEKVGSISECVEQASGNPVADVISDPPGSIAQAGDYLLLLTYCSSMFSNYTAARPGINGKSIDEISDFSFQKSISGIPISPEVNYFFQSEWEYLYHGSEDAGANLSAVSRLIYLVRVICNYITVFSVSDVTVVINSIRTAFSWNPPLGIVLGELARAAFVAAESAVDLAALRAGYKVPLIKNGKTGQWVCSPAGLADALGNITANAARSEDEPGEGVSYSNYMLFFFLAKGIMGVDASAQLAERTARLMEWNVINYKNSVYCDEEKMAQALEMSGRFRMDEMKTDFCITTTVDMRMLFLSMALAQNFSGSRGLTMPRTMPVTVTDYRGY